MVLQTKNRNRIIARPLTRTPVTLQQVHDHEPEPRLQSALQRLRTVLDAPLKTMPADIGWFDAHFPKDGFDRAKAYWSSAQAYSRWRNTIRRAVHRHAVRWDTSNLSTNPLRVRHLLVTKTRFHSSIPTSQIHVRADIDGVRSYYANFHVAVSGPKSD